MSTSNGTTVAPTAKIPPSEIPSKIDLLVGLHIHLWPALTLAIQNAWGTSNPQLSEEKRDWLAGAITELFHENQLRDVEDLEEVLDHAMNDEFEASVEDDSLEEVARKIWKGVERVRKSDGSEIQELMLEWERKRGKKVHAVAGQDQDDEDDYSGDEEEWNGFEDGQPGSDSMDVDMDEAPALVDSAKSKKTEPEVDEDGFTKVVGKKKR